MKVTEITVNVGCKINLGDYNSASLEMWAKAELEEGESPEEAAQQLFALTKTQVREQAKALKNRERDKSITAVTANAKETPF